jgi:formylglycine-generating enzyme required for sulfatase activity
MGGNADDALAECKILYETISSITCDHNWFEDEEPVYTLTLDEYYIDKYEVTNAEFGEFLNQRGNQEEGGASWLDADEDDVRIGLSGGEWQPISGYADHPVTDVTWYGAQAYCAWREARLPTEAEWEKAARGTEGWIYPWGNNFDGERSNFCDSNCSRDWSNNDYNDGYSQTAPVGSYLTGVSPYGLYDMAGNVWEWVADWYDVYPGGDPNASDDFGQTSRVLRGGSWYNVGSSVHSSERLGAAPDASGGTGGFRCARSSDDGQFTSSPPTSPTSPPTSPTETPTHQSIPSYIFWTQVTNGQYAAFLNASGNQMEGGATWLDESDEDVQIHGSSGSWVVDASLHDSQVVEVTWYGARAYCDWAGGKLPSEGEWNRAEGKQLMDISTIWDWTVTSYSGSYIVIRAYEPSSPLYPPDDSTGEIGFRCASMSDSETSPSDAQNQGSVRELYLNHLEGFALNYDTNIWKETEGESERVVLESLNISNCTITEQGPTEPPPITGSIQIGDITFDVFEYEDSSTNQYGGWYLAMEGFENTNPYISIPVFIVTSPLSNTDICLPGVYNVLETLHSVNP